MPWDSACPPLPLLLQPTALRMLDPRPCNGIHNLPYSSKVKTDRTAAFETRNLCILINTLSRPIPSLFDLIDGPPLLRSLIMLISCTVTATVINNDWMNETYSNRQYFIVPYSIPIVPQDINACREDHRGWASVEIRRQKGRDIGVQAARIEQFRQSVVGLLISAFDRCTLIFDLWDLCYWKIEQNCEKKYHIFAQ